MLITDPKEIEPVLAFFRKHMGRELEITMSLFEGLVELERMQVAVVGQRGASQYHVRLVNRHSQRQLEIDFHHYSFATVSPDQKRVEVGRLLSGNITLRLTASVVE